MKDEDLKLLEEKEKILDIYRQHFPDNEKDYEIMFNIEYYANLGLSLQKISKLVNVNLAEKIKTHKHLKFAIDRGILLNEAQILANAQEKAQTDINFAKFLKQEKEKEKILDVFKIFKTNNF